MTRLSITDAAKAAGVSRQTLYKSFINNGKISVSTDSEGKRYIDQAEFDRVFGKKAKVQGPVVMGETSTVTAEETVRLSVLERENELLRQMLSDKDSQLRHYVDKERHQIDKEGQFLQVIEQLTAMKQIEDKTGGQGRIPSVRMEGGHVGSNRMQRVEWIREVLENGQGVNCSIIAGHWNVSTSTAKRDMTALRKTLNVKYDDKQMVFYQEEKTVLEPA